MVIYGRPQVYTGKIMTKSLKKEKLFTNQKAIDRAIKAAVDQYENYRSNTPVEHKRRRKNRAQNKQLMAKDT